MAQINLNVPDPTRVINAFCGIYNRPADSPLTPQEFTKKNIINFIKNVVANYEGKVAEQQARQQLEAATLALKQSQQQFDQQIEAANQRFEQMITAQQQAADARNDEMKNQLAVFMNEQDNKQHQMTELLKNRDDNSTLLSIEQVCSLNFVSFQRKVHCLSCCQFYN